MSPKRRYSSKKHTFSVDMLPRFMIFMRTLESATSEYDLIMTSLPLHLGIFTLISVGGWLSFRSSGLWVLIALLFLLLMSIFYPIEVVNNRFWPIDSAESNVILWFFVGLIVITLSKRLFANWEKPYQGISISNLVWNRIVYDRDMKNWKSWVHRKSR